MLLRTLITARPPQVPRSLGVGITYKFINLSSIKLGEPSINLRVNNFGASYELDALHDNCLKTITGSAFQL